MKKILFVIYLLIINWASGQQSNDLKLEAILKEKRETFFAEKLTNIKAYNLIANFFNQYRESNKSIEIEALIQYYSELQPIEKDILLNEIIQLKGLEDKNKISYKLKSSGESIELYHQGDDIALVNRLILTKLSLEQGYHSNHFYEMRNNFENSSLSISYIAITRNNVVLSSKFYINYYNYFKNRIENLWKAEEEKLTRDYLDNQNKSNQVSLDERSAPKIKAKIDNKDLNFASEKLGIPLDSVVSFKRILLVADYSGSVEYSYVGWISFVRSLENLADTLGIQLDIQVVFENDNYQPSRLRETYNKISHFSYTEVRSLPRDYLIRPYFHTGTLKFMGESLSAGLVDANGYPQKINEDTVVIYVGDGHCISSNFSAYGTGRSDIINLADEMRIIKESNPLKVIYKPVKGNAGVNWSYFKSVKRSKKDILLNDDGFGRLDKNDIERIKEILDGNQ